MRLGCVRQGLFGKKVRYCDECRGKFSYEECVRYRIKHGACKISLKENY